MNAPRDPLGLEDATVPVVDWAERNQRWLARTFSRLHERLRLRAASPDAPTATGVEADIPLAAAAPPSDDFGFKPALLHCAALFGLSDFETDLLGWAAGVELDPDLRRATSVLSGGAERPSFGLAMSVLDGAHWDALAPHSALRHWSLVELEGDLPVSQSPLRIDERLLHFITGVDTSDVRLQGWAQCVRVATDATEDTVATRAATALAADAAIGNVVVIECEPPRPREQRDLAAAVAAAIAGLMLWIEARDLPADPTELERVARRLDREAALSGAVLTVVVDAAHEQSALHLVGRLRSPVLWLGAAVAALSALARPRRVVRIAVPRPDSVEARDALFRRWQASETSTAVRGDDAALAAAMARAGNQFRLAPLALDAVVSGLASLGAESRAAAVWPLAREAARGGLDALAERVDSGAGFEQLVVPPAQMATLRQIARQLLHREQVYREWGFGEKHPRGQGITALFAGESGTGKTLAAEAIAHEVGLDLYRVDLANVVSKYIGETEKNLKRVFDAAEASGAILLFDEADAIFGKRSEVKDSHDRYANIEIAYLLQRVESYRGLAILTTNMRSALDRAFLRRLRFIVSFPFPDGAARERIWRLQFPPAAPVAAIDFAALAQLNVPGGQIRSIVLNAAFKAADAGAAIDQGCVIEAARAEFAKHERSFTAPASGARS